MKTTLSTAAALLITSSVFALSIPATEDSSMPTGTGVKFSGTTGKSKVLVVSSKSTALVKFDLADFGLVANQVQRAKLRIYVASVTTPDDLEIRSVAAGPAGTWAEDAAKGTAVPALDPAAGITKEVDDKRKRFITVDATNIVKSWLATPSTNNGLAIISKGGAANLKLGSKEGFGSGYPAELEIETNPALPLFSGGDPTSGTLDGQSIANGTVGTAQIANSAITANLLAAGAIDASKFASNIVLDGAKLANESVAAEKLTPRTVSSVATKGNVATSSAIDLVAHSTSPELAAEVTLTTKGGPVIFQLVPVQGGSSFWSVNRSGTFGRSFIRGEVGGDLVAIHRLEADAAQGSSATVPVSSASFFHVPPAGTHVYRIYIYVQDATQTAVLSNAQLIAYEL